MELGQMEYKGPFSKSTKTWNGLKLDVCKSGIQKSLRRRNLDEMIWYATEILLFHKLDQQGILTNLMNRLLIMSGEELVFADWHRFIIINEKAKEWQEDRTKHHLVFEICKLLFDGRLLRIGSDIRNTFYKGIKYKLKDIKKPKINEDIKKIGMRYKEPGDSDQLIEYFGRFITLMNKKDDNMFYWALKIYYNFRDNNTGGKRYNKKRGVYILWKYLFQMSKENKNAKQCIQYNMDQFDRLTQPPNTKKGNEQNIFLINAILIVKNLDTIDWSKEITPFYYEDKGVDYCFNKNMKEGVIKIQDYIVDMHCYEGKKKGSNGLTFALEGSLIVNEDKEFFVQEYRDIYHNIKRLESGEEIKTIEKDDLPYIKFDDLGSMIFCNEGNVCGGKRICIEATYKGKTVILKECGKGVNYGIDQVIVDKMKKHVGLKSMNARRVKMDTIVRKVDKKNKTYNDNFRMEKEDAIYIMMDKFEGEMLKNRNKEWYSDKKMRLEYAKIGLFRGIFRVTDFNELNVLVNDNDEMCSIDEMLIGQKKNILGIMNAELKEKILDDYIENDLKKILEEVDFDIEHLKKILKEMKCEHYLKQILKNKENLEDNFVQELHDD